MDKAIKELEDLFGTTAKGNTIYFNDVTYTPIPQPVAEAVKDIMSEYPDVKYRLGMYSVTIIDDTEAKKKLVNNSFKKPVESGRTDTGKLHDDFVTGNITETELKDKLVKDMGYGKQKASNLIDKWKPEIVKSSINSAADTTLNDSMDDVAELEDEFALVNYVEKVLNENGMSDKFKAFCDETDKADTPEELGKVAEKYLRMAIKSSAQEKKESKHYNVLDNYGGTVGFDMTLEDANDLAEDIDGVVVPVESSAVKSSTTVGDLCFNLVNSDIPPQVIRKAFESVGKKADLDGESTEELSQEEVDKINKFVDKSSVKSSRVIKSSYIDPDAIRNEYYSFLEELKINKPAEFEQFIYNHYPSEYYTLKESDFDVDTIVDLTNPMNMYDFMDSVNSSFIKSSLSDYFPVDESQAEELEDKISQFDTKSDIRTVLEDYFHIYDDYAEMSVEEFEQALDGYFGETGDGLYEPEETHTEDEDFYTTAYESDDDFAADSYDGDEYSEGLE